MNIAKIAAAFKAWPIPTGWPSFCAWPSAARDAAAPWTNAPRLCVGELGRGLGIGAPTVSHHLKELTRAGLIRTRKRGQNTECWVSNHAGRSRRPSLPRPRHDQACRPHFVHGQLLAAAHLAEGILRQVAGDLFDIHSAGSNPAGYVHPKRIAVMKEIGIDISGHTSKHMSQFLDRQIDTVITVCGKADQACPMFPGQVEPLSLGLRRSAHAQGTEEEILNVFPPRARSNPAGLRRLRRRLSRAVGEGAM